MRKATRSSRVATSETSPKRVPRVVVSPSSPSSRTGTGTETGNVLTSTDKQKAEATAVQPKNLSAAAAKRSEKEEKAKRKSGKNERRKSASSGNNSSAASPAAKRTAHAVPARSKSSRQKSGSSSSKEYSPAARQNGDEKLSTSSKFMQLFKGPKKSGRRNSQKLQDEGLERKAKVRPARSATSASASSSRNSSNGASSTSFTPLTSTSTGSSNSSLSASAATKSKVANVVQAEQMQQLSANTRSAPNSPISPAAANKDLPPGGPSVATFASLPPNLWPTLSLDPLAVVVIGTIGKVVYIPVIDYALIIARILTRSITAAYQNIVKFLAPSRSEFAKREIADRSVVLESSSPMQSRIGARHGLHVRHPATIGMAEWTGQSKTAREQRDEAQAVAGGMLDYWMQRGETVSLCSGRIMLLQRTTQQLMDLCEDIHIGQDKLTVAGVSSKVDAERRILGSRKILKELTKVWENIDDLRRTDQALVRFFVPCTRPRILDRPSRPLLFTLNTLQEVEIASMGPAEPAILRERLDAVLPYVPNVVLNRITRAATSGPNDQRAREALVGSSSSVDAFEHAILLVVDIKGFSTLAETFERVATASAFKRTRAVDSGEIIAKMINQMFDLFIETIDIYGGDLLKIAGDAVIAAFNLEHDHAVAKTSQREAAIRCCMCVRAIHARVKQLHEVQAVDKVHSLHVHSSVAAGCVVGATVGGIDDAFEFFPAGDAFRELRVDLAQQDQIVISQRTLDAAGGTDALSVQACSDPNEPQAKWWLLMDVLSPTTQTNMDSWAARASTRAGDLLPTHSTVAAVQRYFPRALRPQLAADILTSDTLVSEMRTVSTVFVMLAGLDLSRHRVDRNDKAWEQVNELVQAIQKIIFRFQGLLRQFLVDDKGDTVIIACFGAPTAHEDDTERAVAFAMNALQRVEYQFQDSGVRAYAGVATGRAFCGTVGAPSRHEYAVVGPTVNMAARLMVEASKLKHMVPKLMHEEVSRPVTLLVDAATAQADARAGRSDIAFQFRELPDRISVKGPPAPIAVFAPVLVPIPSAKSSEPSIDDGVYISIDRLGKNSETGHSFSSVTSTALSRSGSLQHSLARSAVISTERGAVLYGREYEEQTLREFAEGYRKQCCAEHRIWSSVDTLSRSSGTVRSGVVSASTGSGDLSRANAVRLGMYADMDAELVEPSSVGGSPLRASQFAPLRPENHSGKNSSVRGLLVKGPAGIGKTSLVRRFLRIVREEFDRCEAPRGPSPGACPGCIVYWGGGDEEQRDIWMHAWAPIFKQLLCFTPSPNSMDQNLSRLQSLVQEMRTSSNRRSSRDADLFPPDCVFELTAQIQRTFILPHSSLHKPNLDSNQSRRPQAAAVSDQRFCTLLIALLRHLTFAAPRLLILDEGRFFDAQSWNFLNRVMREIDSPKLMVVLVVRPVASEASDGYQGRSSFSTVENSGQCIVDHEKAAREGLRAFHGRSNTVDFIPRFLGTDDIQQMLLGIWNASSIHPAEVVEFVRLKSGGNPLLVKMVANRLESSRLVGICESAEMHATHSDERSGSQAGRRRWCALQGMKSLHQQQWSSTQMIQAVLDELPDRRRQIIKIASVVGRCFSTKILHSTLEKTWEKDFPKEFPLSLGDLVVELSGLQEHAIVEEVDNADESVTVGGLSRARGYGNGSAAAEWVFANNMVRDTAYSQVPHSRRKELHNLIGDCYAAWPSQQDNVDVQVLAAQSYHYRLAGETAKADTAQRQLANVSQRAALSHTTYMTTKGYD